MREHPPRGIRLRRLISSSLLLVGLLALLAGTAFAQTSTSSATTTTSGETPPTQQPKYETTEEPATGDTSQPVYRLPPYPTPTPTPTPGPTPITTTASCNATITARVVAFDQVYTYNRFGAFNPAGMIYALANDVVGTTPGNVRLKDGKRPRPIVLRVNEGDCLQVNFQNLLNPSRPNNNSSQTRTASIHVNGLDYVGSIASDGANVGRNASSLAAPGDSKTYVWYAKKQGQYLMYSMGANAGGEGDNGQPGLGLFGSINVEPKGSKWYRSQVTAAQLKAATVGKNPNNTPIINYEAVGADGKPILNMMSGNEIVYTDLNAIITDPTGKLQEDCTKAPPTGTCGQAFREFTVIFHDEIKTVQAFKELNQELFHGVRDGFGINYGSSSLGAMLVANRKGVGPTKNCKECKFEEFFLESWAGGDPALIVKKDANGNATEALFPDDPSNVHHSYLGDPVRFRNLHLGKETHVFHLHAHQWLQSPRDENSTYLDSQTIGPGSAFTYEINYGGSGNRNLNPGDSIFHCHLYPHFAQGMWELWRNHDVFEDGTPGLYSAQNRGGRNLPDAEIAGGTPNPAIVPIPGLAEPPMPVDNFKGFPFYIAGAAGHRTPQPPLDMEWDGGLPRHRIVSVPSFVDGKPAIDQAFLNDPVASRVLSQNNDPNLLGFARKLKQANILLLDPAGTPDERLAMDFHKGSFVFPNGTTGHPATRYFNPPVDPWQGAAYPSYTSSGAAAEFLVNGLDPKPGAPFADPCKPGTPMRSYRAAYIQFDMTVNRAKWHDRQARITVLENDVTATLKGNRSPEPFFFRANSGDCIQFSATNLMPGNLNLDDFQIFTPTDTVGQHIHLVKFDVTASDGAGNGWNYEDGTFSADEVRERIEANNAFQTATNGNQFLTAKVHPRLGAGTNNAWLGAQTTIQRWWADPLVNTAGQDRTIRTVFTHDHFGPSSHQHHGLYGALVVEPKGSTWKALNGQSLGGRVDGGPTSFAANIITPVTSKSFREFNLAFADFAIVYTAGLQPVNPPGRKEAALPKAIEPTPKPLPESISAADPGTQLINYRNEPIPLRIGRYASRDTFVQKSGQAGDLAYAFSSFVHNDPFTPILTAYEGDRTIVRLIQGSQEEQHVFTAHEVKWLFEPSALNSGYRNAQQIGISEHFEFELGPLPKIVNNPAQYSSIYSDKGKNFSDHLYASAATDNLWDGQWGILRIYQGVQSTPIRLAVPTNQGISYASPGTATMSPETASPSTSMEMDPTMASADPATSSDPMVASGERSPDATTTNTSNPDGYDYLEPLPSNPTGDSGTAATTTSSSDPTYAPAAPDSTGSGMATDSPSSETSSTDGAAATAEPSYSVESTEPESQLVIDPTYSSSTMKAKPKPEAASVCPSGLTPRPFNVSAYLARDIVPGAALVYNNRVGIKDPNAILFVEDADVAAIRNGTRKPEPLILRAAAGDCIKLTLTNRLPMTLPESNSWNQVPMIINGFNFNQVKTSNRVSLHPQLLSANAFTDDAAAVGFNQDSTVGPGQSRTYTWYAGNRVLDANGNFIKAPVEFGATNLRDIGDVIKHASHGAIGSLIIEPVGATWTYPVANSKATADVSSATGKFREFVLLYQDDLSVQMNGQPLPNIAGTDDSEDSGMKAFNYRTEPLWSRLGFDIDTPNTREPTDPNLLPNSPPDPEHPEDIAQDDYDFTNALSSIQTNPGCGGPCGDPETPVFLAQAGVPVRFRVLHPAGHPRQHSFALFGHHWNFEPWTQLSTVQSFNPFTFEVGAEGGIGPTRHTNILTIAGGLFKIPGDYLYRTMDSFNFSGGGLWGIFRVQGISRQPKVYYDSPPEPMPPVESTDAPQSETSPTSSPSTEASPQQ